ncbi:phage protease [Thalassolituus sp. ST750PaO-4]|uniref:phage protease n=1 Tax=Thalassolituus sp. ST750PaO-4 TaxID=2742965 RepID=UPI001CE34CD6|nr:phage protease [Thalassolituus sp. ST750PaO-4]
MPGFVMSADIAAALIARLQSRQNDIVVDYEHQTLYAEEPAKHAFPPSMAVRYKAPPARG